MNKPRRVSFISDIKNEYLNPVEGKKHESIIATERRMEELSTGPHCI